MFLRLSVAGLALKAYDEFKTYSVSHCEETPAGENAFHLPAVT
jgi:hypothetical protein